MPSYRIMYLHTKPYFTTISNHAFSKSCVILAAKDIFFGNRMYKKITVGNACLVWLVFNVIGCTSLPTVTEADIPLVHSSLSYSLIKSDHVTINIPNANLLFNSEGSVQISFKGINFNATKRYISATGNKCIRFKRDTATSNYSTDTDIYKKFTSCERNGVWVLISPLVTNLDTKGL